MAVKKYYYKGLRSNVSQPRGNCGLGPHNIVCAVRPARRHTVDIRWGPGGNGGEGSACALARNARRLNVPVVATAMEMQSPPLCSSSGAPCANGDTCQRPPISRPAGTVGTGFLCCVVHRLSSISLYLYFLRSDRLFLERQRLVVQFWISMAL